MEVSGWFGSRKKDSRNPFEGNFGIRVGVANRRRYFDPNWTEIEVGLTSGLWRKCPEFRDGGSARIREWLRLHRSLSWKRGNPPPMSLVPLGGKRFRLET